MHFDGTVRVGTSESALAQLMAHSHPNASKPSYKATSSEITQRERSRRTELPTSFGMSPHIQKQRSSQGVAAPSARASLGASWCPAPRDLSEMGLPREACVLPLDPDGAPITTSRRGGCASAVRPHARRPSRATAPPRSSATWPSRTSRRARSARLGATSQRPSMMSAPASRAGRRGRAARAERSRDRLARRRRCRRATAAAAATA